MMPDHQTNDSKYIQQHLANERTYLAWVRTSITIIGVGFLITNLHFAMLSKAVAMGDALAQIIGVISIAVGVITLILATINYFKKGREINTQTFRYTKELVVFLTTALIIIFLVFGAYYSFVWKLG